MTSKRSYHYELNKTYPIVTKDGIKEMSGKELRREEYLQEQAEFFRKTNTGIRGIEGVTHIYWD